MVSARDSQNQSDLAGSQNLRPSRGVQNPRPLDKHYDTIRKAMQAVFQELGLAA
jgi:hypothetical protein